ncbi:MAG: type II toxin-antitoxin system Phd/YefM family antitoxin [Acidobacteria bacterium]|nr:type II toxin-antitoxin system Phd/YefM family antitoxin [Acidobacteriota bacterium]
MKVKHWPVREAKARFSEVLRKALAEGPQVVTQHGVETAVLVSMDQWLEMRQTSRPTLKAWILSPEPRFDFSELLLRRRGGRRRVAALD